MKPLTIAEDDQLYYSWSSSQVSKGAGVASYYSVCVVSPTFQSGNTSAYTATSVGKNYHAVLFFLS